MAVFLVRLGVFILSAVAIGIALIPILVLIDLLDGGTGWGLCPQGIEACNNPYTTAAEFGVLLTLGLFAGGARDQVVDETRPASALGRLPGESVSRGDGLGLDRGLVGLLGDHDEDGDEDQRRAGPAGDGESLAEDHPGRGNGESRLRR